MPQHIEFWSGRPDSWGGRHTSVGGTVEAWEGKLAWFKDFFRVRFSTFSNILIFRANLAGQFDLTLHFDEDSGGKVVLHQNETSVPYNYNGQYFKLLALHIKAIPDSGYEFVYWAETGNRNEELIIKSDKNIELKPVFRKKRLVNVEEGIELNIFPNPAFRQLTIEYFADEDRTATLKLINELGQEIWKEEIEISTELQKTEWNVLHLARGTYFVILENEGEIITKRIVLDR